MTYDDRVRGFPAFAQQRRGRRFAQTWWGEAWVTAMEHTSLDQGLLRKGRAYAKGGHVGPITVSPGRIAAPVYGQGDALYDTAVFVEQLTEPEWDRFLAEVAGRAGHLAALLDRDMPHDLVAAAEDAGVRLLPTVGDLEPECSCPDWGHPCKHAAALCYQASWLLDADPFVLLLMRGRGERELLDELQGHDVPVPVLPAGQLPPVPELPTEPATPLSVPPAAGIDTDALRWLAADAAVRARELLTLEEAPPALDEWEDTVRIAATHQDARLFARLQDGDTGRLDRAARAWRYGGRAGLKVLAEPWTPAADRRADLARARAALDDVWDDDEAPQLRVWRNRWTIGGMQLRYGPDLRWYPYREEAGDWWPAGPPSTDPGAALAQLLAP